MIVCGCCSFGCVFDGNDCGYICFVFEFMCMIFWFFWFEGLVILCFNIVMLFCIFLICVCCCRLIWLFIGNNWSGDEVCFCCNLCCCFEFNGLMFFIIIFLFLSWVCCCFFNDIVVLIKVLEFWGMFCLVVICCFLVFFFMSNLKWCWYLCLVVCICVLSFWLMDLRVCFCILCFLDKFLFFLK